MNKNIFVLAHPYNLNKNQLLTNYFVFLTYNLSKNELLTNLTPTKCKLDPNFFLD